MCVNNKDTYKSNAFSKYELVQLIGLILIRTKDKKYIFFYIHPMPLALMGMGVESIHFFK